MVRLDMSEYQDEYQERHAVGVDARDGRLVSYARRRAEAESRLTGAAGRVAS